MRLLGRACCIALAMVALACTRGDDVYIATTHSPLEGQTVCCSEVALGASIGPEIGGSAQAQVAVQASVDFWGSASAAVAEITTACRTIAEQLDAPGSTDAAIDAKVHDSGGDGEADRMSAWCESAAAGIATFKAYAGGQLTLTATTPTCQTSARTKASCQARCSAGGTCDSKANPPTCAGGHLWIACRGDCTAQAGAQMDCDGTCTGACSGSCNAPSGVACAGPCQGTCTAQAGVGPGIQADGTCNGTCLGMCAVTAPGASCAGSCHGACSAACRGSAGASVTCDGQCSGESEVLSCEGGTLGGGCKGDARCDANCDATVAAQAICTPPDIHVTFAGAADEVSATTLKTVLEANLGAIFAFKARVANLMPTVTTITGNADAIVDIKAACIPAVISAVVGAAYDLQKAASATAAIVTATAP